MLQIITKYFNYITIRTINMAIFSQFEKEYINKNGIWNKQISYYCGYHKNFDTNDWRFINNELRKNTKYIKLVFIKFLN